jgi:hypothetical protein
MADRSYVSRLDNLKPEREALGWSVTRLARSANLSDATITILERRPVGGTVPDYIAEKIASVMGRTLVQLGQAKL